MCVCVCVCARACLCACVRVCMCACVCVLEEDKAGKGTINCKLGWRYPICQTPVQLCELGLHEHFIGSSFPAKNEKAKSNVSNGYDRLYLKYSPFSSQA